MKRIYFVAGEESGDIHGANLIRAIHDQCPEVACEGLGGIRMQGAGMTLHHDLAGEAIMGFTEIIRKFGKIRRLFLDTVDRLRESPPDVLVLIDYPGFNIRLAKRARQLGIPVVYYVSPQVWAWKKKRVHTLAACVNKMLVIFPFEVPLYDAAGLNCVYVGHPLLDHIDGYGTPDTDQNLMRIGLLPGSREQEIGRLLGPMIEIATQIRKTHPTAHFVTPVVNQARAQQAREIAGDFPLDIEEGSMYEVLSTARFCLVASGTATLETALFGVPMIILYKVSGLTYWLARLLVDIKHIGIVNILADGEIVPEYIQGDIVPDVIAPVAVSLINPTPKRMQMISDLEEIRETLGASGASAHAAQEILMLIEEPPYA